MESGGDHQGLSIHWEMYEKGPCFLAIDNFFYRKLILKKAIQGFPKDMSNPTLIIESEK